MKRLHTDATVDERTVQAAAEGLSVAPKRRRKQSTGSVKADLVHVKVLPEVWAKALELSQGHPSRIQVIGETDVLVHNHAWRKRQGA